METFYPQYAAAWRALQHGIARVDTCRYFYLHRYGGVYVDVDLAYTLRPCVSFRGPRTTYASLEAFLSAHRRTNLFLFDKGVDNALMASRPGDRCLAKVIRTWTSRSSHLGWKWLFQDVDQRTGSSMLRRVLTGRADGCRIARPTLQCLEHVGTNTWRWTAKKRHWLRALEVALVGVSAAWLLVAVHDSCRRRCCGRRSSLFKTF